MTLNQWALYGYIALMFIAPVTGILKIGDIGFGLRTFIYLIQLFVYGYCGGYLTLQRFMVWNAAKTKADREREIRKSNRELVEMSLNDKVQKTLNSQKKNQPPTGGFLQVSPRFSQPQQANRHPNVPPVFAPQRFEHEYEYYEPDLEEQPHVNDHYGPDQ